MWPAEDSPFACAISLPRVPSCGIRRATGGISHHDHNSLLHRRPSSESSFLYLSGSLCAICFYFQVPWRRPDGSHTLAL